ncbi:dihydroneopterin aldolase [Spirulina major CS-329]|uniref:dihydroneopterin aldolase n=1 Tax=Spirulina TaxID=1154 RepID=UPI002330469C|nr:MULTISPECIES: dihydroneopterin aldolase [Spirulina]MDB9494052.1 dihydroneopterin aldolase [Spirulina subsalsa CS-330]MDB9504431.1 dihydroneopterin aldolase [Spirulina major CS-329]
MSSDRIHITNIRAYGYTGALPEETVLGQWFSVDLTLWVDLRVAGARDDLRETLDYREAIAIVQTTIQTQPYALIERLATVISDRLLTLPRITQVRIQLTKEAAPIPNFSGKIAIDITRPE